MNKEPVYINVDLNFSTVKVPNSNIISEAPQILRRDKKPDLDTINFPNLTSLLPGQGIKPGHSCLRPNFPHMHSISG